MRNLLLVVVIATLLAPPALARDAGEVEVGGITLGQTVEAAKAALAAQGYTVIEHEPSERLGARLFARKLVDGAAGAREDLVIVRLLQAPAEPTVAAIWRRVGFLTDRAPTFDSYRRLLLERIGFKGQVRSSADGVSESFRWTKAGKPDRAQQAFNVLDNLSSTPINDTCVLGPPPDVDASGAPIVDGYQQPSQYSSAGRLTSEPAAHIGVRSHCGISLVAALAASRRNPALVDEATFFLIDQGALLKNVADHEALLLAGQKEQAVKAQAIAPAM